MNPSENTGDCGEISIAGGKDQIRIRCPERKKKNIENMNHSLITVILAVAILEPQITGYFIIFRQIQGLEQNKKKNNPYRLSFLFSF